MEIWKDIIGYEGKYLISNTGKIISFVKNKKGKPLGIFKNPKGYYVVFLYDTIKKTRTCITLHKLVYNNFTGQISEGMQINHIDGNKQNNSISNLETCTCKENIKHAINTGLRAKDINLRKQDMFNEQSLFDIRSLINDGLTNPEIAIIYKCHHSTISKIRTGKHYPTIR